jgi:hypothetical protein
MLRALASFLHSVGSSRHMTTKALACEHLELAEATLMGNSNSDERLKFRR